MVNVNLLKAKIVEVGVDRKKIAEKLGISPTSLNYKLNGRTQFKANEIQVLSAILALVPKKTNIFLPDM